MKRFTGAEYGIIIVIVIICLGWIVFGITLFKGVSMLQRKVTDDGLKSIIGTIRNGNMK